MLEACSWKIVHLCSSYKNSQLEAFQQLTGYLKISYQHFRMQWIRWKQLLYGHQSNLRLYKQQKRLKKLTFVHNRMKLSFGGGLVTGINALNITRLGINRTEFTKDSIIAIYHGIIPRRINEKLSIWIQRISFRVQHNLTWLRVRYKSAQRHWTWPGVLPSWEIILRLFIFQEVRLIFSSQLSYLKLRHKNNLSFGRLIWILISPTFQKLTS